MNRNNNITLEETLAKKVANRKLVEVMVKNLKTNPVQPQARFRKDSAKYKSLLDSVSKVGILEHVHHSTKTMHLIHGHRRVETLRDLGIKKVYSFGYSNITQKEEQILFEYFNNTNLTFNRKQRVDVYLAGGEADQQTRTACRNAFDVGEFLHGNGQKYLHKIAGSKLCITTLNEATTGFVGLVRRDKSFMPIESDIELRSIVHKYCTDEVSSPYNIKQILWNKQITAEELYNHLKSRKTIIQQTVLAK